MRIMIADDDRCYRTSTKMKLENLGYDVCAVAKNSNEIIDLCKTNYADVILMDFQMPGEFNGLEAAIQIYENYGIPSVLVSSSIPIAHSPSHYLNTFTYYRKNDDLDFLDLTLKQTKSKFDLLDYYKKEYKLQHKLIQESPLAMMILDQDGFIKQSNNASNEIFNVNVVDMLGENINHLIPLTNSLSVKDGNGLNWYLSFLNRKLDGIENYHILDSKGLPINIEFSVEPIKMNDEMNFIVYLNQLDNNYTYGGMVN